jgi:hypothetical protein
MAEASFLDKLTTEIKDNYAKLSILITVSSIITGVACLVLVIRGVLKKE